MATHEEVISVPDFTSTDQHGEQTVALLSENTSGAEERSCSSCNFRNMQFTLDVDNHVYEFYNSKLISHSLYLPYRLVIACFSLGVLLTSAIRSQNLTWLVFLTHWTYLAETTYFVFSFFSELHSFSYPDSASLRWPARLKAMWILYYVSSVGSFAVTFVYYSLLFTGGKLQLVDTSLHLVNSLQMAVDTFISAIPVYASHFYIGMIYGIIYTIFNFFYWVSGNREGDDHVVYPILNWGERPLFCLFTIFISAVVIFPLGHAFHYGLYVLRERIVRYKSSTRNSQLPEKDDL